MENRFVDEASIEVSSGDGGAGVVHFRREKYVPKGGPDGGDGGDGGDVLFVVRRDLKTLSSLKLRRLFRAESGRPGGAQRRSGRRGRDAVIAVPPGTLVRDRETGELLRDLSDLGDSWLFLKGGRGGKGNARFATSVRQAPRFAEPGGKGQIRRLLVQLALIADVGLVGKPNAGKSTLLSVLTNCRPRIAAYPFTTKSPNVGVLAAGEGQLVVADIPGIIAGASHGAGMGLRFLRHVSRTGLLAFLIDLGDAEPEGVYGMLVQELSAYDPGLLEKPRLLIGTKLDLEGAHARLGGLRSALPGERVIGVSAWSGEGLEELRRLLMELLRYAS
jgi:GTP-binding protein